VVADQFKNLGPPPVAMPVLAAAEKAKDRVADLPLLV
jgi:hypothetical protein